MVRASSHALKTGESRGRPPRGNRRRLLGILAGCTKDQFHVKDDEVDKDKNAVETVGKVSSVFGMQSVRAFGVGIVQGLPGTGHDPQPGELRRAAIHMLKQHGVEEAESFLASGTAAVVIVAAEIPPGARKGDPIDVSVKLEASDKATSLRGGQLLECELREYADLSALSRD